MHGNAGNKMEGLSYAVHLLERGIDLFSFDFSGCGNSEGQYVTLGWKEKDDLHAVLQYLKDQGRVSSVALWGRSMGAATSLLYNKESPLPIKALVLDSSFSNF
jgi:pimeloyl-ACP methyl ester carboxylesterase